MGPRLNRWRVLNKYVDIYCLSSYVNIQKGMARSEYCIQYIESISAIIYEWLGRNEPINVNIYSCNNIHKIIHTLF